jgi:hypothetical protein
MRFLLTATAATVLLAGAAINTPASAAEFTSDHCNPLCGPQDSFATITGTQVGTGIVSVTITPLNGNGLVGGLNGLTTFTFNSTQNQAITFDFGTNALLFDVSNSLTNTALAGDIHQNGFGTFEYGFNYIGAPGGSDPFFGSLTFTLSGTGLTLASFTELSTGGDPNAYLALDIITTGGRTGLVDCCSPGITPFDVSPVPGPIVGAGLPGLIAACMTMLGIRRYRNKRLFGTA